VAAGLRQRYFYEQFTGRDACFMAVLDRIADEVEATVRTAIASTDGADARAEATLRALAELFSGDPRSSGSRSSSPSRRSGSARAARSSCVRSRRSPLG
jgi:AcrR family transcriptional regulator